MGKNPARSSILLAFYLAVPLQAASVTIVNPGFEDTTGGAPFNEFTFGPFAGWNLYDPGSITSGGSGPQYWIGTLQPTGEFFPGAPEGSRVAIAYNVAAAGGGGEYGLQQTLTHTLQANTTYTLSALIGNIASGTAVNSQFFNLDGFPGYRVDLLAGATLLGTTQTINPSIAEGTFELAQWQYTTGASDPELGQALTIRLVNLNVVDGSFPAADLEVDFDNITLTAVAIPEPAGGFILAMAVVGLGLRRRRGSRS